MLTDLATAKSHVVRPARREDMPRCLNFLPAAFPLVGRAPELLVAENETGIVGACATAWLPQGFPVMVHVEPHARRQGHGRALLAAAAERARGETDMLKPWSSQVDGAGAAMFLSACGFTVTGRLHVYELDPTRLRGSIAALLERARRRVPSGVELVAPMHAPRAPLLEMVSDNLTTPRPYLEEALFSDTRSGYDQALSRALLVEGVLIGVVLTHRKGDTMEVDLNVVSPAWRRGWANLFQVDAVLQRGEAAGLSRLRFLAASHVHDTINLAKRGGGERKADLLTMALPLSEAGQRSSTGLPASL